MFQMVMRGDKMPPGTAWRQATVGAAARAVSMQHVFCQDCSHRFDILARDIVEKWGVHPDTPFWSLAQKMRCSKCGSTRVGIQSASWSKELEAYLRTIKPLT
jgi:rubredoxin